MMVEGDFNGDGVEDLALILETVDDPFPRRALLILFGVGDGTYRLWTLAKDAVLGPHQGGVFGDSLVGLSLEDRTLILDFYGGSNWRWYSSYSFRFLLDDWYLIEAITGSFHTATDIYHERAHYHLLKGEYTKEWVDSKGRPMMEKGELGGGNLLSLSDFDARASEDQYIP